MGDILTLQTGEGRMGVSLEPFGQVMAPNPGK